ncbi:hypothetical protein HU200_051005 [Digitaria exilis]|uniref:Uncharacterized protein n=1 Tax=Digitaria exilis TaxID=1010633 RepID=A0A835AR12_9POAL|nr:hypothetical protein HU200_051005 [Digitaria exilis]
MPPVLRSHSASARGGDLPAGDVVDPDYLYFLQHIRVDGDSYVLELPGNGSSPPSLLKYEAPPPPPPPPPPDSSSSDGGECVSDPSPGRLSTNRRADERDSSASLEATPPAGCDSLDAVDDDYRLFLQHARLVDGQLVLEVGGVVINYDQPVVAAAPRWENGKQRGVETASPSPGRGVGVGAETIEVGSGAPANVVPEQYACDWRADSSPRRKVKGKDGGDQGLSNAGTMKGVYWEASSSDGRRAGRRSNSVRLSDTFSSSFMSESLSLNNQGITIIGIGEKVEQELGIVWPTHITKRPDSDFKRRLIEALTEPVARKEYYRLFDTVTIRTPLMKLRQVRNETKFYPTEEMGSSYLDHYPGKILHCLHTFCLWTHLLMHFLHLTLDLAEQIMNSGRRNGLALMRGFLFWLQNSAHDDQFKPWVDDSEDQEVIPVMD